MPVRTALALLAVFLLMAPSGEASAQFGNFSRITSPNGRKVLEIRMGTMPANRNLVFTAVITAGPISGSTSLMLQQALARDIFNPSGPAPGWTVVRSSLTAFSLGGGCGRNNLIDFPFINNNRPEILRITGTTQQVITLNISGNNDQYDSIDCSVSSSGQVIYILTNRTRQTLELRREQGGLLQLVRDNFGTVRSPFLGGVRPSIRFMRPGLPSSSIQNMKSDPPGGTLGVESLRFIYDAFVAPQLLTQAAILVAGPDGVFNAQIAACFFGAHADPFGFDNVNESAVTGSAAVADPAGAKSFELRFYDVTGSTCTLGPAIPMSSRSGGTLYTFAGIAAAASESGIGGPGTGVQATTIIDTNTVATFENGVRSDATHPMAGRGGPKAACPIRGSETDGATLITGPGGANTQVQQSVVPFNLREVLFSSSSEEVWEGDYVRCDEP